MKRILRSQAVQGLLASAIVAYARLLVLTMRWTTENAAAAEAGVASPSGAIVLFWHGAISQAMACHGLLGDKPRRVMISLSRDGDFISLAAERLGVPVIRGSTGKGTALDAKGGGGAFREALRFLNGRGAVLLTPDGPRGPREVLSMGAIRLAVRSRVPVFLAGFSARPSLKVRSWDEARLPLPFARGRLVIDGPAMVPHASSSEDLEAARAGLEARLRQAQSRADAWSGDKGGRSGGLALYRSATTLVAPFLPALLRVRAAMGKEDPARLGERLGHWSRARPEGRLVWLHGASIGECLSLTPLIDGLRQAAPDVTILATSATRTAAELLALRLPTGVIHQYAPLDTPAAASAFIAHWRPSLAVFAMSEVWPNLISHAKSSGAATALVSARLSAASYRRWLRVPAATAGAVFGEFDLILARDSEQADRFRRLGGRVEGVADLSFAAEPLPVDETDLALMRSKLAGRPMVLAASTHRGEEALLLEAWRQGAAGRCGSPLLVIAPRHPARGGEVRRAAQTLGYRAGLRSARAPGSELEVYVADTVGELGLFYRLCSWAIIGGSFVSGVGGHNPLEPARLGRAFITGPHVENWPVFARLVAAGASQFVDADGLGDFIGAALRDPTALACMAAQAARFVEGADAQGRAGIARILEILGR